MKNLYMVMRDGKNIKLLPYEEDNALPVVYAENEEKALEMVTDLFRMKERSYIYEDVLACVDCIKEDRPELAEALDKMDDEDREEIVSDIVNSQDYWDDLKWEIESWAL